MAKVSPARAFMNKAVANLKNGIIDMTPAKTWTYTKPAAKAPRVNNQTDLQSRRMSAVTKKQKTFGVPGAK